MRCARFVVAVDAEDAAGVVESVGPMRLLEIRSLGHRQSIDGTVGGRQTIIRHRISAIDSAHRGPRGEGGKLGSRPVRPGQTRVEPTRQLARRVVGVRCGSAPRPAAATERSCTWGSTARTLQALCDHTLFETHLEGLGERVVGKVRDSYLGKGRRILVVTDRVSCFDRVVGTIPLQGPAPEPDGGVSGSSRRNTSRRTTSWLGPRPERLDREGVQDPARRVRDARLPDGHDLDLDLDRLRPGRATLLRPRAARRSAPPRAPPRPPAHADDESAHGEHDELTSRAELIARGTLSEALFDAAQDAGPAPLRRGHAPRREAGPDPRRIRSTSWASTRRASCVRDRRDPHARLVPLLAHRRATRRRSPRAARRRRSTRSTSGSGSPSRATGARASRPSFRSRCASRRRRDTSAPSSR